MKRYIPTTREPLTVGDQKIGVREVIRHCFYVDRVFNESVAGGKLAIKGDFAVEESEGRDYIALSEDVWNPLCEALSKPQPLPGLSAYSLHPMRKLIPFIEDVNQATEVIPEPKIEAITDAEVKEAAE